MAHPRAPQAYFREDAEHLVRVWPNPLVHLNAVSLDGHAVVVRLWMLSHFRLNRREFLRQNLGRTVPD